MSSLEMLAISSANCCTLSVLVSKLLSPFGIIMLGVITFGVCGAVVSVSVFVFDASACVSLAAANSPESASVEYLFVVVARLSVSVSTSFWFGIMSSNKCAASAISSSLPSTTLCYF
jgi:hypothetical protein